MVLSLGPGTIRVLAVLATVLVAGTLVRLVRARREGSETARERVRSAGTWWVLSLLVVLAVIGGPAGVLALMAVGSLVALREAVGLVGLEPGYPWLAAGTLGLYAWAWADWLTVFTRALPPTLAAALLAALVLGLSAKRLHRARDAVVAIVVAAAGPSFVVAVAFFPNPVHPAEPGGWILLLFALTELNDMAQAWWGRAFGSRPLVPALSPGKTWEGLAGGVVTTTVAAVVLAPMLTPWGRSFPAGAASFGAPWLWSAALGLSLSLAGIGGDLLESGLKRRAGVKDSGELLPGQGGLMDRVDSLSVTAPVFFALVWFLAFPAP